MVKKTRLNAFSKARSIFSLFRTEALNNFASLYTPSTLRTKSSNDRLPGKARFKCQHYNDRIRKAVAAVSDLPSRSGRNKRMRSFNLSSSSVPSDLSAVRAKMSNFIWLASGEHSNSRLYTSWLLTTIRSLVLTSPHAMPAVDAREGSA